MEIFVNGETPFKPAKDCFSVAGTTAGYQIAYSADGETWTLDDDAVVPAGENLIYLGCMPSAWYKLSGNVDDNVIVIK